MLFIKGGDLGNKKKNVEKNTKKIYINNYLAGKRITQDWQKVVIPFNKIKGIEDIDLKNLVNISFNIPTEGEHIVYIDNILFIKQE